MFPTGTHHTRPHPLLFTCLLRGNSKYKPSSESRLHICDHRCQSPHICGVSSDNFCFPEKWTEYRWWLAHCKKSSTLGMAVKTQLLQVFTQKRDTRIFVSSHSFLEVNDFLYLINMFWHLLNNINKKDEILCFEFFVGFVQHCSTLHCVHTVNQLTFIYINSQQQMAHISLFCKVKKVFKFKVCSFF